MIDILESDGQDFKIFPQIMKSMDVEILENRMSWHWIESNGDERLLQTSLRTQDFMMMIDRNPPVS